MTPLWKNRLESFTDDGEITCKDVLLLHGLARVLAPFAELTDSLQTELGYLGMILPVVAEICRLFTDKNVSSSLEILAFTETLGKNFSSRYNRFYGDTHIILAALLGPRFKAKWIARYEKTSNIAPCLIQAT